MGYDLATAWMLWFFGACAIGGIVGFLLGKLLGFEFGLGAGLLIPGVVSLGFTAAFVIEYRDFRDNPSRASGRVVAIEDRPANESGNITTPIAVVEFSAADGSKHRAESKGGSGLHVDDEVTVVYAVEDPARSKVGRTDTFLGGAIASMLFGTFPTSAAIFYLLGWITDRRQRKPTPREVERASKPTIITPLANLLIIGGLLGGGLWPGPVIEQLICVFGVASIGLWVQCIEGFVMRRDVRWSLVLFVLAINFSAWVLALWLLREPTSQW